MWLEISKMAEPFEPPPTNDVLDETVLLRDRFH
jgi:hypothetical protein